MPSPTAGRILIVDDEEDYCSSYAKYFRGRFGDSVTVVTATTVKDATDRIRESKFDVVFTDMVFPTGPGAGEPKAGTKYEAGYYALLEMKNEDPGIEVVAYTSAPSDEQAVRCMRAGCLDYVNRSVGVEKLADLVPEALQLAKSGSRRRMLEEQLILADWKMAGDEKDNNRKGKYLEALVALLLGSVPGWTVRSRVRTSNEEIDLVISNETDNVFWQQRGSFILVECKNWSGKVKPSTTECAAFYRKIQRRSHDYCRLGIFVSLWGVTKGFEEEASAVEGTERPVIIVLNRDDVWNLVCAPDRAEWLKQRVEDRVFG